eukprot:TRINITY_DN32964_c0_g1_i1.p1 TRINITY_DN32964_c0_g1~~TRINITY_DN32964_c0_g1_i1.p1  ORF type:complete len:158 (+),score=65.99 TRINITY_DN32964_c0_g1_i1:108-581(+)
MVFFFFFFFKQKTAYEMLRSLVGSEMCIRDRYSFAWNWLGMTIPAGEKVIFNEVEYTSQLCYCNAIMYHAGDYAYAWYNLLMGMQPDDNVDFPDGREITYEAILHKNVAFYPADIDVQNRVTEFQNCLLYTSDAADEEDSVDLGGRRIIKKKNNKKY